MSQALTDQPGEPAVVDSQYLLSPQQIHFFETFLFPTADFKSRVFSTGQASTQLIQVEHSSEITVLTLSTFMKEGHALVHKLQSIQDSLFLLIFKGLSNERNPNKAPYGHKYLHQKFLNITESTISTAITISEN